MYTAILVDDEQAALNTLSWEIERHLSDVEIVAQFDDPHAALEKIQQQPPDILFLDIQMPKMSGFELLQQVPQLKSQVIFVTAYDQYAVQAFRINATDYLLKPFESTELIEAFRRAKTKLQLPEAAATKNQNLERLRLSFQKIPLHKSQGIEFVFPHQVVYCQSDGSYTSVILERRKVLISRSLGEFAEQLVPHSFMRVHKSYLVNLSHIQEYVRTDGGYLIMDNGHKVPVSRRKKEQLMQLF